ncbi:MAG TPA: glycosyltransferase family 4 protein [Bdellovibrionota bacterium]
MKPSICFYSVASHLGGGERSMLDLVAGLHEQGTYAPWVLLPDSGGKLHQILEQKKIPVEVLPLPRALKAVSRDRGLLSLFLLLVGIPGMILYFLKARSLLRRKQPVLLHTNGIKCHLLGAALGASSGIPVLWHMRDILAPGLTRRVLLACCRLFRPWILCNSAASQAALRPYDRTAMVHNGIDPAPPAQADNLRARLGAEKGERVLGILGVLARWKGQELFLDLGKSLIEAGLPVRLAVVGGKIYDTMGDEDYEALLRRKVKENGLERYVHFTGFVENPQDYVRQLDCLVHCSLQPEPFGRVIVEAMACGVPVIAADAGGVKEIIEPGQDGLLYRMGDLSALRAETMRLMKDPALAARLAKNGEEKARRCFSVKAHLEGVLGVYRQIL